MHELPRVIPDQDVLLGLEPEELAAKILFLLRQRSDGMFHLTNLENELNAPINDGRPTYPQGQGRAISLAFREAWSWLVAQGLLVPAGGSNGQSGFVVLSRRAQRFEDERQFANYAVTRLLQRDMLHPSISDTAWQSFMRGAYPTAVFEAMREVEIAVREAAGFAQGEHGVPMIRRAFGKAGPLTDLDAEEAEREALANLFAGAVGSYKNPHSHRNVPLTDPREAAEVVMLASHLLRIVDARAAAMAGGNDV